MQFLLAIKNKRIDNSEAISIFRNLEDGEYVVELVKRYPRTILDNHKLYRLKVKSIANSIGEPDPDTIHQRFKSECGLGSSADFTIEKWIEVHEMFQRWVFLNLDIII